MLVVLDWKCWDWRELGPDEVGYYSDSGSVSCVSLAAFYSQSIVALRHINIFSLGEWDAPNPWCLFFLLLTVAKHGISLILVAHRFHIQWTHNVIAVTTHFLVFAHLRANCVLFFWVKRIFKKHQHESAIGIR